MAKTELIATCSRCGARHALDEMTPFIRDTWLCAKCLPLAEREIVAEIARREKLN
jgi:hypothetical protein